MKSKKQIIAKRKRVITEFNKLRHNRQREEYNLTLGELISLNWVLNEKVK